MATDLRKWITLPVWLRPPESGTGGAHQLTLFARAVGGVLNGVQALVFSVRRQWIAATATGVFLEEHGKDRSVWKRVGETEAAYRARVLEGLRAKAPGETKAGMRNALDTLGLQGYALLELYTLSVQDVVDPRWNVFEVRYPNAGNEGLTDAEIQERIDRAKPPRAKGIAVRYRGAVAGFGRTFGSEFGY